MYSGPKENPDAAARPPSRTSKANKNTQYCSTEECTFLLLLKILIFTSVLNSACNYFPTKMYKVKFQKYTRSVEINELNSTN